MKLPASFLLTLICLNSANVIAIEESKVRESAHTVYGLYLTPHEAFNMKQALGDDVLFIDVRARAELKYTGSTRLIDANIPTRFLDNEFDWSERSETYRSMSNEHFIEDVEKLLSIRKRDKTTPVILMCTSGSKVPNAAEALHEGGFKTVYSLYQGFSGIKSKSGMNKGQRVVQGWKNSGLPWSYRLKKDAMYFNFDSSSAQAPD